MGFYKNTGTTKEIKAQFFAEKIVEHYKADSCEYRLKQRRFKSYSGKFNKYTIVTPLYISKSQIPSQGGQRVIRPFQHGDEELKIYIKDALVAGFYVKYRDNLKGKWHCYGVDFVTSTKK